MKKPVHEPDTIVSPTRLPPVTINVTLRELLRKRCPNEDWKDDGFVAKCVRSPNHGGHCDFGVYMKARGYVTMTVSQMPKGDA